MNQEQREQAEYDRKLRRDSRKTADKLFSAHKRQLLKTLENGGDEARLPILKIDIMPVAPANQIVDPVDLKTIAHTLTAQRQGLPQGLPNSTVRGLLVQRELTTSGAFEQLYIGANGHVGFRTERMFGSGSDDRTFNAEGVITRAHQVVGAAHDLYARSEYGNAVVVRLELAGIRDWSLVGASGWDDDAVTAVLPQYVVEKQLDKLVLTNGFNPVNTAIDLGHDILWQLGVSS